MCTLLLTDLFDRKWFNVLALRHDRLLDGVYQEKNETSPCTPLDSNHRVVLYGVKRLICARKTGRSGREWWA